MSVIVVELLRRAELNQYSYYSQIDSSLTRQPQEHYVLLSSWLNAFCDIVKEYRFWNYC